MNCASLVTISTSSFPASIWFIASMLVLCSWSLGRCGRSNEDWFHHQCTTRSIQSLQVWVQLIRRVQSFRLDEKWTCEGTSIVRKWNGIYWDCGQVTQKWPLWSRRANQCDLLMAVDGRCQMANVQMIARFLLSRCLFSVDLARLRVDCIFWISFVSPLKQTKISCDATCKWENYGQTQMFTCCQMVYSEVRREK